MEGFGNGVCADVPVLFEESPKGKANVPASAPSVRLDRVPSALAEPAGLGCILLRTEALEGNVSIDFTGSPSLLPSHSQLHRQEPVSGSQVYYTL